MYHLTTSTGLDNSAADPAVATAALRTELDQHLAAGPVRWNVAVDGLPGQHMGQISVPEVESPESIEFIDDLVATVVDNLTADCAHVELIEACRIVDKLERYPAGRCRQGKEGETAASSPSTPTRQLPVGRFLKTGDSMTTDTATAPRAWARGMFTTEAATELLIGSFRGRFAAAGNPWAQPRDDEGLWIDFDAIPGQAGALSSGERALLLIAASIGGSTQVNLGDGVGSLDRRNLGLVLAALAHANGSHRHSTTGFETASGRQHLRDFAYLLPWPE